ncbi:PDZ and LIM domain protein 2-like isoform X1 [Styela clava]
MPRPRVQTSLTLFGSPPYGFRISGGIEFNQPLVITRVTPGSLAARSGVQSGDVVIAVNNQYVQDLSQDQCEAKVRQAVGSLHMVLEKNAAKVTELPGGQVQVDGDRSIYTAVKDTQQRISKYNRSAKPFGAPATTATECEVEKPAETKPGFKPVSFKPKTQCADETTLPTSARGEPDGINSATEGIAKVTIENPDDANANGSAKSTYDVGKYNRRPAPFKPGNASNNSNVATLPEPDDFPPPPDFVLDSQEQPPYMVTSNAGSGNPTNKTVTKKIIVGGNSPLGLYSGANAAETYKAQVGDL